MTQKSILMLSDDGYFARACERLGVELTVMQWALQKDFGLEEVPPGVRRVFVQDSRSIEQLLLAMRRAGLEAADFGAVYTTDEGAVVTAAALGAVLGVRSLSPRVAANFRDKSLAKAVVAKAGIDTARFVVIDDLLDLPAGFEMPFETAVLKPVVGGGAYMTQKVSSLEGIAAAAERARDEDWPRTFVLEEFMPGDEWHADGVIAGGSLKFLSVGRYQQTCLTTIAANQPLSMYLFDPVGDQEAYDRVRPVAERALRALGLETGVFHMELFSDPRSGRLAFGECGARRGGGLIEEEVRHKFGVSLTDAAVACALGEDPVIEPSVRPYVVGCVFLPTMPGTLVACPRASELEALPDVAHVAIELPAGYRMPSRMPSTETKIGQVLLTAKAPEDFGRRAAEIVEWFCERTAVIPEKATPARLRAWQAETAQYRDRLLTAGKAAPARAEDSRGSR